VLGKREILTSLQRFEGSGLFAQMVPDNADAVEHHRRWLLAELLEDSQRSCCVAQCLVQVAQAAVRVGEEGMRATNKPQVIETLSKR
jgi:hypothetical protein